MKIEISTEKLSNYLKTKVKLIFTILFVLFVFGMGIGTYFVLNPTEDESVAIEAEKKKQELNINFDKKTLLEIHNKKSPAVIIQVGGRNPFMPY